MNTHYAMAAIYGLGLRGIANQTKLPYGPIGSPGVTRDTLVKLPTSLESATAQFMRKESVARKVFGDFFVDHFGLTREHELELNRRAVTDWESEYHSPWGGRHADPQCAATWSSRNLLESEDGAVASNAGAQMCITLVRYHHGYHRLCDNWYCSTQRADQGIGSNGACF